jgi:glutamyl-tRNA reductase
MPSKTVPNLIVVGLNHHKASLELRESLVFSPDHVPLALQQIQKALVNTCPGSEAALLSTCNRTELVLAAYHPFQAIMQAVTFFADQAGTVPAALESLITVWQDEEAAGHLLRVAAGLESLLPGENEILGQVRHAWEIAQETGTTGPYLSTVFRFAVQAGKRVRSETEIGRMGQSYGNLVVALAQEMHGNLADRTALLIGAGKISSISAQALVRSGLRCVLVANRTFERAERLARSIGGPGTARAVRFQALSDWLDQADIVISSTGAPHTVLHSQAVEAAMDRRSERPLLVIDLAAPRDVDPEVGDIQGVRLIDLNRLGEMIVHRWPLSAEGLACAEDIVNEELECWKSWLDERKAAPWIEALHSMAREVTQEQVARTLHRDKSFTPEQEKSIRQMAETIANRLVQKPICGLKAAAGDEAFPELARLAERLYGFEEETL